MNRTGAAPPSSHTTTAPMYAANGVTWMIVSTGCAARSRNCDAANGAPMTRAMTKAMRKPAVAWTAVVDEAEAKSPGALPR